MSYATHDFTESLERSGIDPSEIASVLAAWGKGDGQGDDAGHFRWAEEGVTDWHGGFVMKLRDRRFAYLTGWCDYTGWGCQDGWTITYFDSRPSFLELKLASEYHHEPDDAEWDIDPADLNRYLSLRAASQEPPPPGAREP